MMIKKEDIEALLFEPKSFHNDDGDNYKYGWNDALKQVMLIVDAYKEAQREVNRENQRRYYSTDENKKKRADYMRDYYHRKIKPKRQEAREAK